MASLRVMELFKELQDIHKLKDEMYAGEKSLSNFRRCEAFGIPAWKGCLVRMSDKWSRLMSLVASDDPQHVNFESLDDTLRDLAVYSVITLALREEVEASQIWKRSYVAPEETDGRTK